MNEDMVGKEQEKKDERTVINFIMMAIISSYYQLAEINAQLKVDCSSRPSCEQAMELEEQRLAEIKAEKAAEQAARKGRATSFFRTEKEPAEAIWKMMEEAPAVPPLAE